MSQLVSLLSISLTQQSRLLAEAADLSEVQVLFQAQVVGGGINFLAAVELNVAWIYKASRKRDLLALDFLLKGSPE
jgi:hypothetical protein